jgi:uncharacterized repeat protein (TIGR01451 family)
VTLNSSSLAAGVSASGTLSYTAVESDLPGPLVNTVTVTGTSPTSQKVTDTDSSSVALTSSPAIATSITPSASSVKVGDTITYTYRVTNTGNTTLDPVVAVDNRLNAVTLNSSSLAAGVSASGTLSYTAVEGDLPGPLVNTVTVTGTSPISEKVHATDTATVKLTASESNHPPDAKDDTATTEQDTPVDIDVLANDSDPDGDALTIAAAGTPTSGTATISGTQVAYTPTAAFTGTATFSYTVSDGTLTDSATVTVTVTGGGEDTTPDLKLTHGPKDNTRTAKVGDIIIFIINYINEGNATARGVVIKVIIPNGTEFWFESALAAGGWSCENGDTAGTECSYEVGDVAPGESGSIELPLRVVSIPEGGVISINPTATDADGTPTTGEPEGGEDSGEITVRYPTVYLPMITR